MCGISVYLSRKRVSTTSLTLKLETMNSVQAHRGPDHSGTQAREGGGLGHARLSIIDLSEKANQPLTVDGNAYIVYNGEVYNFPALRAELEGLGHSFNSASDTEVALRAWLQWGRDAFTRFDGMFALAILDFQKNKLIAARDRLGIKPLHYFCDGDKFIMASEMKAILAVQPCDINLSAPDEVLTCGLAGQNVSFFQGIRYLPPGNYLEVQLLTMEIRQTAWFNLLDKIEPQTYHSRLDLDAGRLVEELEGLLRRSVEMHVISDAPLGVLCSGGLDSSLITALAAEFCPGIQIFHAGVVGGGQEEAYAKKVAGHLNLQIEYAKLNKWRYLELLADSIFALETPMYHPNDISLYSVCEKARSSGIKVLLCGEGADELFGGYKWLSQFLRRLRYRKFLMSGRRLPRLTSLLKKLLFPLLDYSDEAILPYSQTAGLFEAYGRHPLQSMLKSYSLLYDRARALNSWQAGLDAFDFLKDPVEQCGNALLLDNLAGHLASILFRTDRMGMLASIENRVPFLENHMIQFALNLPLNFKVRGSRGKTLLKAVAEKYLPKKIVHRPKQGFPVPWADWLEFNPSLFKEGFLEEELNIRPGTLRRTVLNDSLLLFRATSLEIWGRLFSRGEPPDSVKALVQKTVQPGIQ